MNSGKPREWHLKLPYLLFAYRTIPHRTTGLSPYQMVFGSIPRGPLSVLSEAFIGKYNSGSKVKRTVAEHMANLALGAEVATRNSDKAQEEYVDQYNERAFAKEFQVGQQVLILVPDCSNRLLSQWMRPVTVLRKISDFSSEVELENGRVRKLHANKLRPFQARVDMLGVIFDEDEDMGNVEVCDLKSSDGLDEID